jgi:hypothetical protein
LREKDKEEGEDFLLRKEKPGEGDREKKFWI